MKCWLFLLRFSSWKYQTTWLIKEVVKEFSRKKKNHESRIGMLRIVGEWFVLKSYFNRQFECCARGVFSPLVRFLFSQWMFNEFVVGVRRRRRRSIVRIVWKRLNHNLNQWIEHCACTIMCYREKNSKTIELYLNHGLKIRLISIFSTLCFCF